MPSAGGPRADLAIDSEDLAAGRLVEVLAEHAAPGPALHALWRPGRQQLPRVRVVLDWLVEVLG